MAGIEKIITKVGPKIMVHPDKALVGVAGAVPVVIEAAVAVAPVAVVGAAGYGLYRLGKWILG